LKDSTTATLARLTQATWFDKVGVKDAEGVDVLPSWKAALKSCASRAWEDLCLEAANRYREQLRQRAPDRFVLWNDVVDAVKPLAQQLVRTKTQALVSELALPKDFIDTVEWDILHVLMEAEFADVCPPGFYASQAYWYVIGHFPCGWKGRFPEGRRVVF
jgi:hypothetical protein